MKSITTWFKIKYSPIEQMLLLGFFVRMLSVIFSKGFGWHDDHFLIIETSQSWVDGYFNYWLPTEAEPNRQPQGHALFYIGLHYYFFKFLKLLGILDPQIKMFFVRLIHAFWSLLIIKYGYKITEQYSSKKVAWYVGLFLAFYWFMPFISVRNLVEFVCVPTLLMAIYELGKANKTWTNYVLAGFWLGIGFSIRFQSVFITAGIGLALLLYKTSLKNLVLFLLSFCFVVFITQGLVDIVIWKRPFAEFMSYVEYNVNNATTYGTDNWHMYFDLVFGLLIPPLSFVIVAGYFYSWKKVALIFWPVLLYLSFHTYFPNKQERFVMTVIPLIVISGTIGAFSIYDCYKERINRKLFLYCKIVVICLNLILLPVLTLSYSKRHRVEAMSYLRDKNDARGFMIEDSNKESDYLLPPLYYFGKWSPICGITKYYTADSALFYCKQLPTDNVPNYVVFWQAENLKSRVDSMRKRFPGLAYETSIEPSFIDKTLFFLNPLNDNQTAFIYKIN